MGEIILLVVRLILLKLVNANDPKMIRWRELGKVRKANHAQKAGIRKAVRDGDTALLSDIWRELHDDTGHSPPQR
jgi:hypothetical protein